MKRRLFIAGLLITGLSMFLGGARAGPYGGGFHGGFAGRGSGGAFRAGSFGRGGSRAYVRQGNRFSDRVRFFRRERRYRGASGRYGGAYGYYALYPYDGYLYPYDGYLDDYPAAPDYGVATIDPESNASPAAVQAAPVQGGYYPGPVYVVINTAGNTPPVAPVAAGSPGAGGYGPAGSAPQQTNPVQEPGAPAMPGPDRPRPAPSPKRGTPAGAFDTLALVSWSNENGKDTALIENTETKDVRQITSEPDRDNLRIVAIHPSLNPKLSEVVISNGTDQRAIRFRSEGGQ